MSKSFLTILVIILALPVAWLSITPSRADASIIDSTDTDEENEREVPNIDTGSFSGRTPGQAATGPFITSPVSVKLNRIPDHAEIIFLQDSYYIYAMDRDGGAVTQITFERPRNYEHVAVSFDRRFIVANEQLPNPTNQPGGNSVIWLYDLERRTEAQLVPGFKTAGNGGVDWDVNGFIYFAALEKDVDVALSKKKVKRKTDPIVTITWVSTDNTAVASHEILFAEDGVNFSTTVIAGLAGNEQSFTWIVPDSLTRTETGRIKDIARDTQGNAGETVSKKLKIK